MAKEGIARSFQDSIHSAVESAVLLVHLNSAYRSLLEISQLGGSLSPAEFDRYLMSLQLARFLGVAGNGCALSIRSDTLDRAARPDKAGLGRSARWRATSAGGPARGDALPCAASPVRWLDNRSTRPPRVARSTAPYVGRSRRLDRPSWSMLLGIGCVPRRSGVSEARSPR